MYRSLQILNAKEKEATTITCCISQEMLGS